LPQEPQLPGSNVVLVQVPEQLVSPDWQLKAQVPLEQTLPAAQAWAQAPQLALSVCKFTQIPEQLVSPV
jgi:hypothetical protein